MRKYFQKICRFVVYKDIKALVADLKAVYGAANESAAMDALDFFTKKWTGRRQDWSRIHAQLAVYFADRMPD